ncbi:hypothetical protein [Flavobacterium lindanitolerans]|uniref:Lipocalin-like protein n=1 Tax=Flavobacterium lindanitolerans TaxID=428988 RepID=A0A497V1J7_9FLAO|nr:hypothetical protein [Flavobacterium lindanitolerans]MBC8643752.1 hypothetical protein [Flavobacterium lindanitolerans]PKW28428.1 hypothetical protein B0G92_0047 [Flavobacterium lindanitolerans]RLJ36067.1 hypothetical protein CLV50_1457 [Flavobacterium lindanitolerans]
MKINIVKNSCFRFYLSIIILSQFTLYSQEVQKDNKLLDFLCRKWTVEQILVNGQKVETHPNSFDAEFKRDYTFIDGSIKDGSILKWSYDSKNKKIKIFSEGKLIGIAKIINSKQVHYLPVIDEEAGRFVQSVEMYLKPI